METERLDATAADGRLVAVWRSHGPGAGGPVIVLAPGFCRTMRHMGAVALTLVLNGAVVYRFDPIDHLGLSDGDVRNFTISGVSASLDAVVDLAVTREAVDQVTVLAASLLARPAIRVASRTPEVTRLVLLAAVVDVRYTLRTVLGEDYGTWARADLPAEVTFERHQIDPVPLWEDVLANRWGDRDGTIDELCAIDEPVVAVHATDDEWSRIEDVQLALDRSAAFGPRDLYQLPFAEHDLGGNLAAMPLVLRQLTLSSLPALAPPTGAGVVVPILEHVVEVRSEERRRMATEVAEARRALAGSGQGPMC